MNWQPLTFKPILRAKTWGGRRLATTLGKPLPPGERVGESWEVSDWPGGVSVVEGGEWAGQPLHQLLRADPVGLVGRPLREQEWGRFPLLAKFIDAGDLLSLQVHPDEAAARRLNAEHHPKTECWYVVEAEPGAWMYLGLRAGVSREEFARALRREVREEIEALLNTVEVHPDEFIFAPAGIVHAIGRGMLFAEVSQTSDSTLRLYDWGRLPRRPTHIEEGLAVLHLPEDGLGLAGKYSPRPIDDFRDRYLECPAFTVERVRLPGGGVCTIGERPSGAGRAEIWMTVRGRGHLRYAGGGAPLTAGRTLLLPAGAPRLEISAGEDLTVLVVRVGE